MEEQKCWKQAALQGLSAWALNVKQPPKCTSSLMLLFVHRNRLLGKGSPGCSPHTTPELLKYYIIILVDDLIFGPITWHNGCCTRLRNVHTNLVHYRKGGNHGLWPCYSRHGILAWMAQLSTYRMRIFWALWLQSQSDHSQEGHHKLALRQTTTKMWRQFRNNYVTMCYQVN